MNAGRSDRHFFYAPEAILTNIKKGGKSVILVTLF